MTPKKFIIMNAHMEPVDSADGLNEAKTGIGNLAPGKYLIAKVVHEAVVEEVPARTRVRLTSLETRKPRTDDAA